MVIPPWSDPNLDIVLQFAIRRYNDVVDTQYRLPDFGLGIFLGNSRAMWPRFVRAWRADPALRTARDPVQRWTERVVSEIAARIPAHTVVRFAHDEPPQRIAMQKLAEVIGLAALSPSHLCIHPRFGPWFGMRAVICVDAPGPTEAPAMVRTTCECETGCMPHFRKAMAAAKHAPDDTQISEQWKLWLAVRDACPAGRTHRYTQLQAQYHYTKDRSCIDRSKAEAEAEAE